MTSRVLSAPAFRLGLLLLFLAVAIIGYIGGRDCAVLEPDIFPFDPGKPYRLRLARGSNYTGQNEVAISASGYARLQRVTAPFQREQTTTQLTRHQLLAIADAVSLHNLPGLNTEYINEDIRDGEQWALSIFQGGREKHVYFSNRFTYSIWYFAIDFDDILQWSAPETLIWTP